MSRTVEANRVIEAALREFGSSLAVLTSFQREGVVILDMVLKAAPGTTSSYPRHRPSFPKPPLTCIP